MTSRGKMPAPHLLLPVAYCPWSVAHCLLPVACCLLAIAVRLGFVSCGLLISTFLSAAAFSPSVIVVSLWALIGALGLQAKEGSLGEVPEREAM
jgi:hypothetical protein